MDSSIPREQYSIITHSGTFHLDEIMATALLKIIGLWNGIITRTRDRKIIDAATSTIMVDVGGAYDHERLMYDHHQQSFAEYFNDEARALGIKMSSFGLVYKHYGKNLFENAQIPIEDNMTAASLQDKLHQEFYKKYVMEIDAGDNGVSEIIDGVNANTVFKYYRNWHLSGAVSRTNGMKIADTGHFAEAQDYRFKHLVDICAELLTLTVGDFIEHEHNYYDARSIIQNSATTNIVDGKLILILPKKCDYERAMKDHIAENAIEFEWVFTILPREDDKFDEENDNWQVHTIGVPGQQFKQKINTIGANEAIALIKDKYVFVHVGRFIAVTKSKNAAYNVAVASVRAHTTAIREKLRRDHRTIIYGIAVIALVASIYLGVGAFRYFM